MIYGSYFTGREYYKQNQKNNDEIWFIAGIIAKIFRIKIKKWLSKLFRPP